MIRQSILCATCACLLFAFGPPGRLVPPNRPGTLQHTKGSTMQVKAYLQITMQISEANRPAAVKVYRLSPAVLDTIEAALTKDLLVRDEDVQVLHGFDSVERAKGLPGKRPVQRRRRNRLGPYVGRRPQHRRVRGRIAPYPFGAESANLSASLVLARAPHLGALLVWRTPAGEGARRVSVYWISNENAWEGAPLK